MARGWACLDWGSLLAVSLSTTGCFTIAKQAFQEARGAQADVVAVTELRAGTLARYRAIEFLPAKTTVGPKLCPPEVLRAYDYCANQTRAELRRLFPGEEPRLTVASEVLYFQKKGLLGGALMLTRVRLSEGDQLLADVVVKAESESFRAGGEDDLAGASLSALRRFLEGHAGIAKAGQARGVARPAATAPASAATRPAGP